MDKAAGIREEFLGVEAETYGAETRFEIVGEEKYTKSNEGKMNKGCQCVKKSHAIMEVTRKSSVTLNSGL